MEKVTKEKQLTVVMQNTMGTLAEVTGLMADKGVNIENVCAYTVGDVAVVHLLTDDNEKARTALEKKGYRVVETEVIVVQVWNRPGSLSAVAAKFRQHAINVQYVYGTSSLAGEKMTIVFSSDDNDKAAEVFDSMVIEEAQKTT
ncbi:MAG: ACT domain-containing protein [Verrucomicrobiota bacterium]